jgi:peptidoglycan/LPS O-acetylase OafA/YrhL
LTAIRGIAALWVVTHHLTLAFRYPDLSTRAWRMLFMGYTGVDLFFVLSGFILTSVYLDLAPSGLGDFALRRILRIYPLHLAVLAFIAIMSWFSIIWSYAGADWATLPAVALLIHPYLGLNHGFWNGVTWSAGIELSCYLWFPVALFLLRRLPTLVFLLLITAAAYTEWTFQAVFPAEWTGWLSVARGWHGFALGMALGLLATRVRLPRAVAMAGELAAAAVLGWAIFTITIPLVPLAAGAFIWMLSYEAGPLARLLSRRAPVYLGKISFSIYLLHLPLRDVFDRLWPMAAHPSLNLMLLAREGLFFTVLIILASVTHRLIERPAQSLWRARKPRVSVAPASGQLSLNAGP